MREIQLKHFRKNINSKHNAPFAFRKFSHKAFTLPNYFLLSYAKLYDSDVYKTQSAINIVYRKLLNIIYYQKLTDVVFVGLIKIKRRPDLVWGN